MASPFSYLKKPSFVLLLSALFLLSSAQSTIVKYCDKKANYDVKVKAVEIYPDPVVSGKPATFNISTSTVHVHTETHKPSEEISCPTAAGNFVLSHTQTLPGSTPPGSYALKMTMNDGKDRLLTCRKFDFKISFGTLVSDHKCLNQTPRTIPSNMLLVKKNWFSSVSAALCGQLLDKLRC